MKRALASADLGLQVILAFLLVFSAIASVSADSIILGWGYHNLGPSSAISSVIPRRYAVVPAKSTITDLSFSFNATYASYVINNMSVWFLGTQNPYFTQRSPSILSRRLETVRYADLPSAITSSPILQLQQHFEGLWMGVTAGFGAFLMNPEENSGFLTVTNYAMSDLVKFACSQDSCAGIDSTGRLHQLESSACTIAGALGQVGTGATILASSSAFFVLSEDGHILWSWGYNLHTMVNVAGGEECIPFEVFDWGSVFEHGPNISLISVAHSSVMVVDRVEGLIHWGENEDQVEKLVAFTDFNEIIQLTGTASGHHLLMRNGSVFTWNDKWIPFNSAAYCQGVPLAQLHHVFFQTPLDNAVPSSHIVTRLSSCAWCDGVLALAEQIDLQADISTPELVPITIPQPDLVQPITWGSPGQASGIGSSLDVTEIGLLYVEPQFVDMSEFRASLPNFTDISCANTHCLALATDGFTYGWGMAASVSPVMPVKTQTVGVKFDSVVRIANIPELVDAVAVRPENSLLLTRSGNMIMYGRASAVSKKRDHSDLYPNPDYDIPDLHSVHAPYSQIRGHGSLFAALGSNGAPVVYNDVVSSFGFVHADYVNVPTFGPAKLLVAHETYLALVNHQNLLSICILRDNALPSGVNPSYYNLDPLVIENLYNDEFNCSALDLSTTPIGSRNVTQMVATKSYLAILTNDNKIFTLEGETAAVKELDYVASPDSITSIAYMNRNLYAVDKLGKLFVLESAIGREAQTLFRTKPRLQFSPIPSSFIYTKISSDTQDLEPNEYVTLHALGKLDPGSASTQTNTDCAWAFGDRLYGVVGTGSPNSAALQLPPTHPLTRPSAGSVSVSAMTTMRDGNFSMVWGGIAFESSLPNRLYIPSIAGNNSKLHLRSVGNGFVAVKPNPYLGMTGFSEFHPAQFVDSAVPSIPDIDTLRLTLFDSYPSYETMKVQLSLPGYYAPNTSDVNSLAPESDVLKLECWSAPVESLLLSSTETHPFTCVLVTSLLDVRVFGRPLSGYSIVFGSDQHLVDRYTIGAINTAAFTAAPATLQVGADHAMVLLQNGQVATWGSNNYRQTTSATESSDPFLLPFAVGAVSKIACATDSSFVLLASTNQVLAWGRHDFGQLGIGTLVSKPLFFGTPTPVLLPPVPTIREISCAAHSCYALYVTGNMYSWGLNHMNILGREIRVGRDVAEFDATPALFAIPGKPTDHTISAIMTSSGAFTIFLRTSVIQSTQLCTSPAPGPGFICNAAGQWYLNSTFSAPSGGTVTIPSNQPVLINGNLSIPTGATIVFEEAFPRIPVVVSGCVNVDGTLQVTLTEEDIKAIEKSGGSRQSTLIVASCTMGTLVSAVEISQKKSCKAVTGERQTVIDPNGSSKLNVLFKVDSKKCNTWWIILVSVLGGVLLLVGIFALLATFTPLKQIIRPFVKRQRSD